MGIPHLTPVPETEAISSLPYDSVVLVTSTVTSKSPFQEVITKATKFDKTVETQASLLPTELACGGRLVVVPCGSLDGDTDDVRNVGDAAAKGILRAKSAGSVRPLLLLNGISTAAEYSHALPVALLSMLEAVYEHIQARETLGEGIEVIQEIGFLVPKTHAEQAQHDAAIVKAIEEGRRLARDVGGSDPERMTPIRAAAYITQAFVALGDCVKVKVIEDDAELRKNYPLLHAVARASVVVPRHRPCVVHLEYNPKDAADETLLISGKGVTYDTGGADVKAGGHMAGMSRDKCGAANAAGLVLTAAHLRPEKVRIVAELGFVRNSVGADSYVADEIITSHSGARVQVGNTDAEGRMVLSDCLSHLRDQVLKEDIKNPRLFTIATLTGHVLRAYGPYTAVVENGPAVSAQIGRTLQATGQVWGDPLEVSTLRREDYDMIAPKNKAFDLLQCNNAPSSGTARGHQFPAAFILKASGVSEHGKASKHPLPFTHIDIAGSAVRNGDYQFGTPSATPIVALTAQYLLPRVKNIVTKL